MDFLRSKVGRTGALGAKSFASQASVSLENARLYEDSLRRAAELDERSQRLALLNRFSSLLSDDSLGQGIYFRCAKYGVTCERGGGGKSSGVRSIWPEQDGQLRGEPLRSFAIRWSACTGLYVAGRGLRIGPPIEFHVYPEQWRRAALMNSNHQRA